ncbi:MAG: 50S ribosomal protein L30 [Ktedonobacterales bacterium]
MARLRITYTKSAIGYNQKQKLTIKALGLRRLQHSVEHNDTPVIRGMINKVSHLVTVEEIVEEFAGVAQ